MNELKQVILVRRDIKMSPGKLASQVAHASVEAVLKIDSASVKLWREQGATKVVLSVLSETKLSELLAEATKRNIPTSLVIDDGLTEVKGGTVTCGVIGPGNSIEINELTGTLELYT